MNSSNTCDTAALTEATALDTVEWFWREGVKRRGRYRLSPDDWLRRLYEVARSSQSARQALSTDRPAMGIWGPSQTGKSTSISAYMDGSADLPEDESLAGTNTGLHWEGGRPFYFMAPMVDDPSSLPHWMTRKVLNPYNKGMDGSACLSRFTAGSLTGESGRYEIKYPEYPVRVELVPPADLWHAIARGYTTECINGEGQPPAAWTLANLRDTVETCKRRHAGDAKDKVNRDAYEALLDLCEVLRDLSESDEPRFRQLGGTSGKAEWEGLLTSLLADDVLLSSVVAVKDLAAELLWEGYSTVSDWHGRMHQMWQDFCGRSGRWSGRPVQASMEATAILLNMAACKFAYMPPPSNPLAPAAIIQELIRNLSWKVQPDCVLLGCHQGGQAGWTRLGDNADNFSVFQALVWELVIPVNLKHLLDKPFPEAPERGNPLKDFLEKNDILDFPGVGNETKSNENRIVVSPKMIREIKEKASHPDASPADREREKKCFSQTLFFEQLIKRGKTASIVCTYSRRLTIDSFSIFQGIRGYACPNADQIVTGVRTWWRFLAPDYYRDPQGESPLPLNVVLTWWATPLNKAVNPNDSNIYGVIDEIVRNLGRISNPEVCTTFALHNHRSPDRDFAELKYDFTPGSVRYNNLLNEAAFTRQFGSPVARNSFETMVQDMVTGGAEFFFEEAGRQIADARNDDKRNRLKILETRLNEVSTELAELFVVKDLLPEARPRDTRKEHLEAFRKKLRGRLEAIGNDVGMLRKLNRGLRELLTVVPDQLVPLNSRRGERLEGAIDQQFSRWIPLQADRLEGEMGSYWRESIGFESRTELVEVLQAFVDSTRSGQKETETWLNEIYTHKLNTSCDLRRLLAVRMTNLLYFGAQSRMAMRVLDGETPGAELAYGSTHYRVGFLDGFLGEDGQLDQFCAIDLVPRTRDSQAGDDDLLKLYQRIPGAAVGA